MVQQVRAREMRVGGIGSTHEGEPGKRGNCGFSRVPTLFGATKSIRARDSSANAKGQRENIKADGWRRG